MEELTLDGKKYLSSKKAAKITGYAKDYVGQLCREGRVDARQVGRSWYVSEASIRDHRFGADTSTSHSQSTAETQDVVDTSTSTAFDAYPATYTPESVEPIPGVVAKDTVIESRVAVHDVTTRIPADAANEQRDVHSNNDEDVHEGITKMQAAWQSWFNDLNDAKRRAEVDVIEGSAAKSANNIGSSVIMPDASGTSIDLNRVHKSGSRSVNTSTNSRQADPIAPGNGTAASEGSIHHIAYIPGAAAAAGRQDMIVGGRGTGYRHRAYSRERSIAPVIVNAVSILLAVAMAAAVFYTINAGSYQGVRSNSLVGAVVQFISGTSVSHFR